MINLKDGKLVTHFNLWPMKNKHLILSSMGLVLPIYFSFYESIDAQNIRNRTKPMETYRQ
jgi:hypothetical protein